MKTITDSSRLLLREWDENDARDIYLLNADPEVLRYTGDRPFQSPEEARNFLINYDSYRLHHMGRWAVIRKSDTQFLGWCGLKKHPSGMVDLGFRLFRREWGRGYASEAAQLSLAYGFEKLELHELVLRCRPENVASVRIAEKLGMTFWKKANVEGLGRALWYRISREGKSPMSVCN